MLLKHVKCCLCTQRITHGLVYASYLSYLKKCLGMITLDAFKERGTLIGQNLKGENISIFFKQNEHLYLRGIELV